ncbi:nuclear transport factor 2 family protein [Arthrobacter sp.]|uniref:nuclear transport factor 2 family protein n=1 Tax=Arthrobacter sp. TaxID=1667 RepID=UPI003A94EF5B
MIVRPSPAVVVSAYWAARERGDETAARELLAEDLEWTVVGRHAAVVGTYRGPDQFFNQLVAGNAAVFQPGTAQSRILGIFEDAQQNTVVTHTRKTARTRTGLHFDNEIVTIMTIAHGRIRICREFMDLAEVNRTFGANPPLDPTATGSPAAPVPERKTT